MDPETNDWFCSFFTRKPYTGKYLWLNFLVFGSTHLFSIYGAYLLFTRASVYTWIACFVFYHINILGITMGAHRCFSHRAYKANVPLRIILMLMQSSAYQRDIIQWCLWHRVHHKWTDTPADPHNITRGSFFGHIGWLLLRPTKEYEEKKKLVDISDLEADPVVRFQVKFYPFIAVMCASVGPALLGIFAWGEEPMTALSTAFLRWTISLHITLMINSVAHVYGMRPYNHKLTAAGNIMTQLPTLGEGYHNFHHSFPYDYRGSELGFLCSESTYFINFFAWIGWATKLKTATPELVQKRRVENMKQLRENSGKG